MPADDPIVEVDEEEFIVPNDGLRPSVDQAGASGYKFQPWDKVSLYDPITNQLEGPYLIEKTESGKYTLCDESGKSAKNGQFFEETDLRAYNHFR